jgi:hypothetical protein
LVSLQNTLAGNRNFVTEITYAVLQVRSSLGWLEIRVSFGTVMQKEQSKLWAGSD